MSIYRFLGALKGPPQKFITWQIFEDVHACIYKASLTLVLQTRQPIQRFLMLGLQHSHQMLIDLFEKMARLSRCPVFSSP